MNTMLNGKIHYTNIYKWSFLITRGYPIYPIRPGRYYYAFAYVTGPEGGLNGTLSPAVEIFVPTASNNFAMEPRLLATPRVSGVQFSFAATQEFGLAWVPVSDLGDVEKLQGRCGSCTVQD